MEWNNMDVILQKYYEDRLLMCSTDAWKELMKDVAEMLKYTDTLSSVSETHSVDYRKGEVSMMRWMLSVADVSEETYMRLKDATDE
jgi:hypothetical protein